jgi:hypothetical protein
MPPSFDVTGFETIILRSTFWKLRLTKGRPQVDASLHRGARKGIASGAIRLILFNTKEIGSRNAVRNRI